MLVSAFPIANLDPALGLINPGEDARLYEAVESCSDFAIGLGINIPTGKDSLSMKQKYKDQEVLSPGTVIISAAANCNNISNIIEPVFQTNDQDIYYINLANNNFNIGGSAFSQILDFIGSSTIDSCDSSYFKKTFNVLQNLIKENLISSGHDISSGGLITTILEMCFSENNLGANIDLNQFKEKDLIRLLFSESLGLVFQGKKEIEEVLNTNNINFINIGKVTNNSKLELKSNTNNINLDISKYRDIWFKTSYLLDQNQSGKIKAKERFENFKKHPLNFKFPNNFNGKINHNNLKKVKAAVIREKGSNSEREMAYAMTLAGFEVKDVHMTDLISGRENLDDINFIVAVGGFSNSDVLGSAQGGVTQVL